MKKETVKHSLICVISVILLALVSVYSSANQGTDMIMPSVYLVNGMSIWYVILISLFAEAVIVKWFLKETYLKSASITLLMNAVSTVLGFVTLHIVSLIVEVLLLPFDVATFHISHWIVNFLLIVLMNAAVEGLTVKWGFKLSFKKNFLWLCLANAISVVVWFLLNLSWTESMYF